MGFDLASVLHVGISQPDYFVVLISSVNPFQAFNITLDFSTFPVL
jgi:hypothetical protein